MLETLTRGFRAARQRLSGEAEIAESDIDEALREVRKSLLEADVEFRVTKAFLGRVKERVLGETVKLRAKTERLMFASSASDSKECGRSGRSRISSRTRARLGSSSAESHGNWSE